jgi:Tfp pilus assembly protein PilX
MNRDGVVFRKSRASPRGAAMIVTIVCLVVIAALGASLLRSLVAEHRQALRRHDQLQAFWLAESAVQRGVARLAAAPDYAGEDWRVEIGARGRRVPARTTIRVEAVTGDAQARRIVVEARCPAEGAESVLQQREIVVALDHPGESS